MNVVFDTNVLLSATLWDGSVSQKLLFKIIKAGVRINSSLGILNEYQRVLKRDFEYNRNETAKIMEKILSFVNIVVPKEKITAVEDDPDDDKILECAVESNSEYIVTYDKHLLKIREFRGIRIIKPEELMGIAEEL